MLHCSFSLAAAQLLVKNTSALQKSECCSATSAAQHSENCSATSVFACGMLQGWGLEGWGLGLPEAYRRNSETVPPLENQQVAHYKKQMIWWICLDSALAGAEDVTESKMSRNLEIKTFRLIKALFIKTLFS